MDRKPKRIELGPLQEEKPVVYDTQPEPEPESKGALETKKPKRRNRVPLGTYRMKLEVEQREGYVRRWVCDRPGRVEQLMDAGYEYVRKDTEADLNRDITARQGQDSRIQRVVGVHDTGEPMVAYLMETPSEFYSEDQDSKLERTREVEKSITRGSDTFSSSEGRYAPSGGTKIEHK